MFILLDNITGKDIYYRVDIKIFGCRMFWRRNFAMVTLLLTLFLMYLLFALLFRPMMEILL